MPPAPSYFSKYKSGQANSVTALKSSAAGLCPRSPHTWHDVRLGTQQASELRGKWSPVCLDGHPGPSRVAGEANPKETQPCGEGWPRFLKNKNDFNWENANVCLCTDLAWWSEKHVRVSPSHVTCLEWAGSVWLLLFLLQMLSGWQCLLWPPPLGERSYFFRVPLCLFLLLTFGERIQCAHLSDLEDLSS